MDFFPFGYNSIKSQFFKYTTKSSKNHTVTRTPDFTFDTKISSKPTEATLDRNNISRINTYKHTRQEKQKTVKLYLVDCQEIHRRLLFVGVVDTVLSRVLLL